HEPVPAQEAKQHLAGIAAEPAAAPGEHVEQPDLVGRRPFGEERAEAAMLLRDLLHEADIVAHRHDFRTVADDARIGGQTVPKLFGLERQFGWVKAEERRLETRPFRLDHTPDESRREHTLGHLRENPVVAEPGQQLTVRPRREQPFQRSWTPLPAFRTGANGAEWDH